MNQLHNTPTGSLIDELGKLKAEIAPLINRENMIKDELKQRMEPGSPLEGKLFRAVLTDSVQWRVDKKALEKDFGDGWTVYGKPIRSKALRISARSTT